MRKQGWFGIAAVLLAAGCAHPAAPAQSAPTAPLATVRAGALPVVLDENGTVGAPAAASAQLAFVESGTIATVGVSVGQRVTAGEALASLDARPLALAAQSAQAEVRAAAASERAAAVNRYGARVDADRAALQRAQHLYAAGVVAQKDIQDARATLAADEADALAAQAGRTAAQAQVQSAQAKAQAAETDLERATLRSPIDGVVAAVLHRPGETVDPSTPVVVVVPPSQREITLRVPSTDAAQIAVGDPARIGVTGLPQTVTGRVTAVVNAVDPATQAATVVLSGVPQDAPAGAAVLARITVASAHGLLVPQTSIVADPQRGDDVVFVRECRKDGSYAFAPRVVTVAHENGEVALLSSGVRAGDRVAAQGAFELLAPAGGGD